MLVRSCLQRPAVYRHPTAQQCGPGGGALNWHDTMPYNSLQPLSWWCAGLLCNGGAAVQPFVLVKSHGRLSCVKLHCLRSPLACRGSTYWLSARQRQALLLAPRLRQRCCCWTSSGPMMLVSVLSCSPAHQIPLSPLQGLGFPLLCGSEKPSYGTACERLESCIAIAINEAGT